MERPLDIRPLAKYAHLLEGPVESTTPDSSEVTAPTDKDLPTGPISGSAVTQCDLPVLGRRRRSHLRLI